MFRRIMVPVDLAHLGILERALTVAAEEARRHDAHVTYVSVTSQLPGAVAHNPHEFSNKIKDFSRSQAEKYGINTSAHAIVSHDPSIDVDKLLLDAVEETDSDLVIIASHHPGVADYFWPSHGGNVATHSGASVMVVRDN